MKQLLLLWHDLYNIINHASDFIYSRANTTCCLDDGNTKGGRQKKRGEEGERGGGDRVGRVKRWRGKERGGRGGEEDSVR